MRRAGEPTGRKFFEIFSGLFDFGAGTLRNGFLPAPNGGRGAAPVNLAQSPSGVDMTPKRALMLSTAWACTWLLADSISTLPFNLMRRQQGKNYGLPDDLNPLSNVVGLSPNLNMDAPTYWGFMDASTSLWGNAYSLIDRSAGQVMMLSTMLPQFMTPYRVLGSASEIRYRYQPGFAGAGTTGEGDYSSDQVFHLRDHTLDGLIGLSRIEYGAMSMGIARATELVASDIYRNGMNSAGFLSYDKTLKPEQRTQIREALEEFKRGGPDAAKFMLLEAGVKFEGLSIKPTDAELLDSREFSVEEICRWFNVPPILIGHTATGVTAWGSGIEQLLLGFRALTIRPRIRKIEAAVQAQLVVVKDRSRVYLSVDTDDLMGADAAGRSQLYSTYAQNGIMTRNEIRAKEDLAPVEGGDELTVQSNLVPIDKLGVMGGQPTVHAPPAPPPAKKVA